MKEIYLFNNGDGINKVRFQLSLPNLQEEQDELFGHRYAVIEKGSDDIIIVKNYLPTIVYRVCREDNYLDILARGFDTIADENLNEFDVILLKKPSSIRYVVSPLETIDDIALRFGLLKEDILINNKLSCEKLFVGQILWI